ncbi:MAG: DUF1850 domain-containing protein [Synergistaceae bacterium]|jgi:hypothetical protein|nr:DUF1850 domain-containing protein [Synergistaceae bacterium]
MGAESTVRQGRRAFPAGVVFFAVLLTLASGLSGAAENVGADTGPEAGVGLHVRIYDWKTGELYVSEPVKVGSKLFFGWVHSLEKIPWNEYYHVDSGLGLVLDAITFPAFGAGIPENKGRVCYVENGLIHMEEIDQPFQELLWLNSHTATQEIRIDGRYITQGSALPQHTRLRLVIERGDANGF